MSPDDLLDSIQLCYAPVPDVDSGDGIMRTNEQMAEWAEQNGCTFENADDHTLFIDIDSKEQLATFYANLKLADHLFFVDDRTVKITPSKSGGDRKHIRVGLLFPLPMPTRILLQACLGSDLRREMMSYKRALDGESNVVVFFERKSNGDTK